METVISHFRVLCRHVCVLAYIVGVNEKTTVLVSQLLDINLHRHLIAHETAYDRLLVFENHIVNKVVEKSINIH